tara:strand:+ start:141 stop:293 length:153 start_codon:yes stop_codon:yes gene_type:complete
MTKTQLKVMHNVPMRDGFSSDEDYDSAKTVWVENHPTEYAAILVAPNENQ